MLAMCALPFWAIAVARELSWGAVFLTPIEMTLDGPAFSSRLLWYKPAIYPVAAIFLARAAYLGVRHRVYRVFRGAVMQRRFPFFELMILLLASYVSACAEGHARCPIDVIPGRAVVLEEFVELVAYAALWLAQARLLSTAARSAEKPARMR